jgi:hypothetical protein
MSSLPIEEVEIKKNLFRCLRTLTFFSPLLILRQILYAAMDTTVCLDLYCKGPAYLQAECRTETNYEVVEQGEPENADRTQSSSPKKLKAEHNHFFAMMRNKSIQPPMKGQKSYPQGHPGRFEGYG